jgi:DNA methylase
VAQHACAVSPRYFPSIAAYAIRLEKGTGKNEGTGFGKATAQHSTAQHSTAQHSTAQHSTAQHSTAHEDTRPKGKNQLYYGDNLDILRRKVADASVDLCYIDPPFNSKRNYFQIYNNQGGEDRAQAQAFVDTWEWGDEAADGIAWITDIAQLQNGKLTEQTVELIRGLEKVLKRGSLLAYLVHMTLRIVEIHRVLKPTGSFYLHCDPTASHYLKLVLDAVFCGQGGDYINEIIWNRTAAKGHAFTRFASSHDVILGYRKGTSATWNALFAAHSEKYIQSHYSSVEEGTGRRYQLDNLINPNPNRPNLTYEFLGITRVWRWTRERMQAAYEAGIVVQPNPGSVPRLKRYLDEQDGIAVSDVWTDISPINSQAQ